MLAKYCCSHAGQASCSLVRSQPDSAHQARQQMVICVMRTTFCQVLSATSIAAVLPKDSMTRASLCVGLAVAARKEVGGSGKGRSVVHRARGCVVAYETSTEQVQAPIHHRDVGQMSCFSAVTLRRSAPINNTAGTLNHQPQNHQPQMEAALKSNPVLADLLDSTAWQHTSDSTISQVGNALCRHYIPHVASTQYGLFCAQRLTVHAICLTLMYFERSHEQQLAASWQVMTDLHLSSSTMLASGMCPASASGMQPSGLSAILSGGSAGQSSDGDAAA